MEEVISGQQELLALGEDLICSLRNSSDPETVTNIKKLQDTIRSLYERQQFEARDLVKSTKGLFLSWNRISIVVGLYEAKLPPDQN